MKESKRITTLRKYLEQQGDEPGKIEATLNLTKVNEDKEKIESLRSWIALVFSGVALLVSILVAIYK